jgi:hypothetical protein
MAMPPQMGLEGGYCIGWLRGSNYPQSSRTRPKLAYQPERETHSWHSSIIVHRRHAQDALADSPSLRREVQGMITRRYASVRRQTAAETRLPLGTFPAECPFTAEQVLDDDFWPQGAE